MAEQADRDTEHSSTENAPMSGEQHDRDQNGTHSQEGMEELASTGQQIEPWQHSPDGNGPVVDGAATKHDRDQHDRDADEPEEHRSVRAG